MKKNITICCLLALASVLGLGACSSDDVDQIPEGMGQVQVRLSARYHGVTRATGDWLDPTDPKELIHDYWVVFTKMNDEENLIVEDIVTGNCGEAGKEEDTFRFMLPPGEYTVFAFANLPFDTLGIAKGASLPDLSEKTLGTLNGWNQNIPMSSHTGGQNITVREAENQSFEVELVRTMAKLEFTFINDSQQQMDLLGYEIHPLKRTNVSLLEPDDPDDFLTAEEDTASYYVDLSTAPLVLYPKGSTGDDKPTRHTVYSYVNETNASATATLNQYSLRMKMRRHRDVDTEVIDYRYGFTLNSDGIGKDLSGKDINGFDFIHRNDWIKLPVMFTDWTFRIEALPFPPIAGFQARVLSADALSITFNSGGYIFLRPMFRNNHDAEGVWRGFDDGAVTFELPGEPYMVNGAEAQPIEVTDANPYAWTTPATGVAESIDSDTGTGIILTGDLDIFEQRFVKLASGDIVGKLTNKTPKVGMVTVTLKLILEGFHYQFNYNIYLNNPN